MIKVKKLKNKIKIKILGFIFLFNGNINAQNVLDSIIIETRSNYNISKSYWDLVVGKQCSFQYKNSHGEYALLEDILIKTDTAINYKAEHDLSFKEPPYLIIIDTLNYKIVSEIIFLYQNQNIIEIRFYFDEYDDTGNYVGNKLLFCAVAVKD